MIFVFRTSKLRMNLLNKIKVNLQLSITNTFSEILKSFNASAHAVHRKLWTKYIRETGYMFGWCSYAMWPETTGLTYSIFHIFLYREIHYIDKAQ